MKRKATELQPGDVIDLEEEWTATDATAGDIVTIEEIGRGGRRSDGTLVVWVVGDKIPVYLPADEEFTLLEER